MFSSITMPGPPAIVMPPITIRGEDLKKSSAYSLKKFFCQDVLKFLNTSSKPSAIIWEATSFWLTLTPPIVLQPEPDCPSILSISPASKFDILTEFFPLFPPNIPFLTHGLSLALLINISLTGEPFKVCPPCWIILNTSNNACVSSVGLVPPPFSFSTVWLILFLYGSLFRINFLKPPKPDSAPDNGPANPNLL